MQPDILQNSWKNTCKNLSIPTHHSLQSFKKQVDFLIDQTISWAVVIIQTCFWLPLWIFHVRNFLKRFRRDELLKTGGELLEIGFGTGLNRPHYADLVQKIDAVDVNPAMSPLARKRMESQKFLLQIMSFPVRICWWKIQVTIALPALFLVQYSGCLEGTLWNKPRA